MKKIKCATGEIVKVSSLDYPYLNQFEWRCGQSTKYGRWKYPYRYIKGRGVRLMVEDICPCGKGYVRDHIDRDTLNNCRTNLRVCTMSHNNTNKTIKRKHNRTSKYKGVYIHKHAGRYSVEVCCKKIKRQITMIKHEHIAAIIYDLLSIDRNGEYSCVNFDEKRIVPIIKDIYKNKDKYGDEELW